MSRNTLNDLFHRSAQLLAPIARRILDLIAEASHVNADETPIRIQAKGKCRRGYVWTFLAGTLVGFVFSDRSKETPKNVLGDTQGVLQVDGYTGYNVVCVPDGRSRAGCMAHCRRYFFEALKTCPDKARRALDLILELYEVEYEAARLGILGTAKHLALRRSKSTPITKSLKALAEAIQGDEPPKSPIGKAAGYALNQWDALTMFLGDAQVRLDNNIAEGALRIIALGRKNFLFVGNDQAGQNLATIQTIVSTCIANDVNPFDYIADVLPRVAETKTSAIDSLLPTNWKATPQLA